MLDNYEKFKNGLIKQKNFFKHKKEYNIDYIKQRYDVYKELSINMSYLRLGYLIGSLDKVPTSILDVGFGNGDFLNAAKAKIQNCFGFEVNEYIVPNGCVCVDDIYKDSYDVVCFFDVLEHFEDIYEIKKLNTKYIYISVPECHYNSDEWFLNWKHRRPDEHLWHFNLSSLTNFMNEIGYHLVNFSNVEDCIRVPTDNQTNILSAVFKNTSCLV